VPLLEGLDGVNKMSKSLGNYIGVTDTADDMFGKVMSISDELMWRYFDLLSFRPNADLERFRREVAEGRNPMEMKIELATEITARFHDQTLAQHALERFRARSQLGQVPENVPKRTVIIATASIGIAALLKQCGLVASTSAAFRLIEQGGIRIDSQKVTDAKASVNAGKAYLIQVGKRTFEEITLVHHE
jgi:tyrosyl-tRNA synthetase